MRNFVRWRTTSAKPTNPAWNPLEIKPLQVWPNLVRNDIAKQMEQGRHLWVFGPPGAGKTTAIGRQMPAAVRVDFQVLSKGHNFASTVLAAEVALRPLANRLPEVETWHAILMEQPHFSSDLAAFLESIFVSGTAFGVTFPSRSYHEGREIVNSLGSGDFSAQQLKTLVTLFHQASQDRPTLQQMGLRLLRAVSEFAEASQPEGAVGMTGNKVLGRPLSLVELVDGPLAIVFQDVELLLRQPGMGSKGVRLFDWLLATVEGIAKPDARVIMECSDSMVLFKGMQAAQWPVVSVDPWPREMGHQVYKYMGIADDVFAGTWDAVGGHVKHLEMIASAMARLTYDEQIEQMRPKKKVDPEEYVKPDDGSSKALRPVSKHETFIRELPEKGLSVELLQFEWKIASFMADPVLLQIRDAETKAHWNVRSLETIRYICSKPYCTVTDFRDIKHPIVLGLLDSNILVMRFGPKRVEVVNQLTRHLLLDWVNQQYDTLEWSEKMEYKYYLLMNSKNIKQEIDAMSARPRRSGDIPREK